MKSKFIIQVGSQNYGCGFHINSRTRDNWPQSFLTDDIDEARIFDTVGAAKAMATRLRNVLLEWVQNHPRVNHYHWEPICVIEVQQTPGRSVDVKRPIMEDLK